VFGVFSGALLLSAVLGPSVGRAIDHRGGRGVLALSNLVLAAGLVLLGVAQGFFTLALARAVLASAWPWGFMIRLSPPSPGSTAVPHWPCRTGTNYRHHPDRRSYRQILVTA